MPHPLPTPTPTQPVAGSTTQPLIRLPMWKLSACMMAAPKLVLFVALGVAILLGGELWDDRLKAEFWAGVVLWVGTASGLIFLWCFRPRAAFYWAPLVIAATTIRMVVSVSLALTLYLAIHPDKSFYWTVFLVASMAILATETIIVRRALSRPIALAASAPGTRTESKAA